MSRAHVSPMVVSDLEPARELWRRTAGMGLGDSDAPEPLKRFLDRNPGLSHIARATDDRLVGAVLCGHDGRRGYLHHLAVEPAFHRNGIGTALVEACLDSLRAQQIPKCNLFVFNDNASATEFWTKRGFVKPNWGPMQRVLDPLWDLPRS